MLPERLPICEHLEQDGQHRVGPGMEQDHAQGMGHLTALYVNDPAMARQLQRLPTFSVPDDTESVFRPLLEKLEQAQSSEKDAIGRR